MAEWISGLSARFHPLVPWPAQLPEILALIIFLLSAIALVASGFRLGRFGLSGIALAFSGLYCQRAMETLTRGTPLWIPSFILPGSLCAVLVYGLIGVLGRGLGADEMTFGLRMVYAGLTTVLGGAALLAAVYAFLTQDPIVLLVTGLILLVVGMLLQVVQARAVRTYHSYDQLYDMPLEIPAGITDRELWGKEE